LLCDKWLLRKQFFKFEGGIEYVYNCMMKKAGDFCGHSSLWLFHVFNELTIECNGLIPNKILIVDLLGKVIFSETFSNKEDNILLDVNRFSSGIYYILMFSKDGYIHKLYFLIN
jgi:hypothetical protein